MTPALSHLLALPRDLGEAIHPARLAKFAREGAVAPLTLLNDFGERRRVASLAAQVSELETTLTDAAIALFERLTAQLFTRSTRTRDQSWSGSKTQAGRLLRLFGGTIDAMVHACEQARDPFDVLDEMVGWERLVASREEIDTLGDLATEDPLSLAASRYVQLRRFAPAFLEAFEFDAPAAGRSLQAAVELLRELNRSGRRKLPDIVPMPFASRQWRALVADNAKTARRTYETAVVATRGSRAAGTIAASTPIWRRRTMPSECSPKAESRPTPGSGSPVDANGCTSAWAKWGRSWHVVGSKACASRTPVCASHRTMP